ncbi:MAG: glycosyltransferase [Rhizobiales bacterium 62-17]|nr:glycosyltransferase family 2 protein [Hyphomicrobiales bacterium]OJY03582.1 MAG: glycosyltransferase [Rhizobiales bacterium 62-17]
MQSTKPQVVYSIVIPLFNEEAVLPVLALRLESLLARLDAPAEVILVNDGSSDTTGIFLRAKALHDDRFKYLSLSRNFGHQIAISAGMEAASGEAVIVMDGDLQDPPELILEMIGKWREGFSIVYAKRLLREGESRFKLRSARLFYRALNRMSSVSIPEDVGDFRLVGRNALDAFLQMPERDRFVRGMFAWLGFKQTAVEFDRPARAAGETKYPLWKMIRLAVTGLIGFSDVPLRLAIWGGMGVSVLALLYGLYVIGLKLIGGQIIEGWASTMVVVSFLCGANMLMTGIIGLYIGRIHSEVKQRPLYVVNERVGFEDSKAVHLPAARSA